MAKTTSTPDVPPYQLHKGSGQGYVNLEGQRVYCGRFEEDPAKRQRYDKLIAEWLANGRRLRVPQDDIRIVELVARFLTHVDRYYGRDDGQITWEPSNFRQAVKPLVGLYGETRAVEFGPLALKAVRERMIGLGWCRQTVNKHVFRVKHLFKWATENELIPPHVFHALQAVAGLRRGRSEAREGAGVQAVADYLIDKTLPHLTKTVRAMVELQRYTGMRPGEVCVMRTCDLDMGGRVWVYTPHRHKTAYRGRARQVFIGPRGQAVLGPWLKRQTEGYIFTPAASKAEYLVELNGTRKTPLSCGNSPGTNRRRNPRKTPGERWETAAYGAAVARGCGKAFPVPDGLKPDEAERWRRQHRWAPNQLRHTYATRVRREHGLESAQVLLGHAKADITQVYAERDTERAVQVALKIG